MAIADVSDRSIADLVSLQGKKAVITGGAQGIGSAIARRLAEAGAAVLIGDIDEPGAQAASARIAETYGATAVSTELDVTDPASIAATADAADRLLGGVDIWVNNAGIYPRTPFFDLTETEWYRVIATNLTATMVGSREAARRMVTAGRGGVIVNLASVAGIRGRSPGISAYVASKHGIVGLTRQLALELARHEIRVLAVAPSINVTPGVLAGGVAGDDPDKTLAGPLGRAGRPDDVARVVLFCASDLSLFMTGSYLLVDSGEMAR